MANAYGEAFQTLAKTHCLDLTATVLSSSVQLTNFTDLLVQNVGSKTAFLCFGSVGADVKTATVVPTAGNPKPGVIPVPAGTERIIRVKNNSYVNGICGGSDTTTVYVTEGRAV